MSNRIMTVIGIILIGFGVIGFSYKYFSYQSQEKIAQIGDVEVTAKKDNTIVIPPVLSGASLAAGILLVVMGFVRK